MMIVSVAASGNVHVDTELPWIDEERLLVSHPEPQQSPSQMPGSEQAPMPEQARFETSKREHPRSKTPTTPPMVSSQGFVLFCIAAVLLVVSASVGFARFTASCGVHSFADGLEKITKNSQTGEVNWRIIGPLFLITFGACVLALVHEFVFSAPTMSDVATILIICALCAALMAVIVQLVLNQQLTSADEKVLTQTGFALV